MSGQRQKSDHLATVNEDVAPVAMNEVAGHGGGMTAASCVHIDPFGLHDPAWQAIAIDGGLGHVGAYHVERPYRAVAVTRPTPITGQPSVSFVAERVLDLPRGY